MNAVVFVMLASAGLDSLIGILSVRYGPKRASTYALSAIAIGMGGWVGCFALLLMSHIFVFSPLTHGFGAVFILGMFVLAWTFPDRAPDRMLGLWSAPFAIASLALIPFRGVVKSISFAADGTMIPEQGALFPLYAMLILIYLCASIVMLVRTYRQANEDARNRLKYFFVGLFAFAAALGIGDIILPATGSFCFILLGPIGSVAFAAATGYAIVRHQVLDIRIVVQRGVIYSLLAGLFALLYSGLLLIGGFFAGAASHAGIVASAGITMVAGIFAFPPLEQFLRRATDPIFFKDRYDYAAALKGLGRSLGASSKLEDLVTRTEKELAGILRAESVHVVLHAEPIADLVTIPRSGSPLALHIPIILEEQEIGMIQAGKKRSGDAYSRQDVELLETFAYHAATALERVRLYQKVKSHADVLEETVRARTAELVAREEREHEMLADISHNLQTPLTVMQTALDDLKRSNPDAHGLSGFQSSLTRLSQFIYDLLKLSRLEHVRETEHSAKVSLSALLDDLSEEVGIIAGADDIELATAIAPDIFVRGNAKELGEAFMNIASNAVKHTRKQAVRRILVSLSCSGAHAVCTVSDTGTGIAPEERMRIFERYYGGRAGASGTGLGLAIAKRIIERHGGSIRAESERGKGAIIAIVLPCYSEERKEGVSGTL